MQSLRRILLATDFGPASPLLAAVTIRLARAFGSVVTPVHVIDLNSDSTLVDYFRRQVGQRMMDFGTRLPATGVMVFHWSGISQQWDKVESLGTVYRAMQPGKPS